jgi:hypothetical protein
MSGVALALERWRCYGILLTMGIPPDTTEVCGSVACPSLKKDHLTATDSSSICRKSSETNAPALGLDPAHKGASDVPGLATCSYNMNHIQ